MLASDKQIAAALGYDLQERLPSPPGAQHTSWAAFPDSDPERKMVLRISLGKSEDPGDLTDTLSTGVIEDTPTAPVDGPLDTGRSALALERDAAQNWLLSAKATGKLCAPVERYGTIDQTVFWVRPFYRFTLKDFVEREVPLEHDKLYHVVEGIWRALAFMHQAKINSPHGRLRLSNVGVDGLQITKSEILLLDSEITLALDQIAARKVEDFLQLGLIAFSLASGSSRTKDPYDAAAKCQSAEWPQLKGKQAAWQEFLSRVLNEASYSNEFDPILDGNVWLKPLRPSSASVVALVAPVRDVDLPAPPTQEVEPKAPEESPQLLPALDQLLEANDPEAVLQTAADQDLAQVEDQDRLRGILNAAAEALPPERLQEEAVQRYLEAAGQAGSEMASLRYGQALLDTSPAVAHAWLERAHSAGLSEAALPLASILEQGGGEVPRNPEQAFDLYKSYLDQSGDPEAAYRLGALLLREPEYENRRSEGVDYLAKAKESGHFRASDLLGQCYATGVGTNFNEQSAFYCFSKAWSDSKAGNDHYYTASNNIGVCFAIGLGTRKDLDYAKHYFAQGAGAGHQASAQNLDALKALLSKA